MNRAEKRKFGEAPPSPADIEMAQQAALRVYDLVAGLPPDVRVQAVGIAMTALIVTNVNSDKRVRVAKAVAEALMKDVRAVIAAQRKDVSA